MYTDAAPVGLVTGVMEGESVDPVQAAEQAHMAFDRWILTRAPVVEAVDTEEDFYAASGIPAARANRVCRTNWGESSAPDRVAARVESVIAWFAARGAPFTWEIWPSTTPSALPVALQVAGLERHDDGPVMTCALVDLPDAAPPDGLRIQQIDDDEGFARWVDTMGAAFAFDAEEKALLSVMTHALGNQPPMRHFLATFDGEPVATASTFLDGAFGLVMNVGTLPEVRGRGIGSSITIAALRNAAAKGGEIAVLQATAMGEPVYRQLGFVECCRALSYVWTPSNS